jgi:metallo-beta-lactamase family protein
MNDEKKLKIKFCGGVGSVTGASFLLSYGETKILVDCGIQQGGRQRCEDDPNRKPFSYNPAEIDYLFVTHAHADHIGRIPKLVKDGFRGKIISTPTTLEIVRLMFDDALNLVAQDAKNCKMDPLYSEGDAHNALAMWETEPYHTQSKLDEDFDFYFNDAGHILGSAIIKLIHKPTEKNIVFTGDLGNSPTPLIRNVEFVDDADYLIMESVYGSRNHEGRELRKEKLKEVLNRVIERKGTLLIPVFSLEKTQVLLHEMNDLIEGGEVKSVPVFFDSPLGIKLTEVYARQFKNFNKKVQERIMSGDDIFDFPNLIKTETRKDSNQIHATEDPKIIIASSGMSVGGRILSHEKEYLSDPKNGILFIGYQAIGSLGRDILEKKPVLKIDKEEFPLKAEVTVVNGYSSHIDSNGLVDFVSHTKDSLKTAFVVMGEDKSSEFLKNRLIKELNVDAVCPQQDQEITLG